MLILILVFVSVVNMADYSGLIDALGSLHQSKQAPHTTNNAAAATMRSPSISTTEGQTTTLEKREYNDVYDEIIDLFGQMGRPMTRTQASGWLREMQADDNDYPQR